MSSIKELYLKLSEINAEIAEISSRSFSNSNPGPILALRSLHRQRDRLFEKIETERAAQATKSASDLAAK